MLGGVSIEGLKFTSPRCRHLMSHCLNYLKKVTMDSIDYHRRLLRVLSAGLDFVSFFCEVIFFAFVVFSELGRL